MSMMRSHTPRAFFVLTRHVVYDLSWYKTAGASLIVVMAVNVISPHAGVLVGYLVASPVKRLVSAESQLHKVTII
jgi:hypothetical protein